MIFIGGKNLALSMLCNIIPPVGLLLFTYKSIQIYILEFRLIPKLIGWAGSKPNMQNFSKYVLTVTVGYSIIMEYCPSDRRKSKTEKGKKI